MSIEGAILQGALQGVTLEVRSEALPPLHFDLGALMREEAPGPLTRLLKPTLVLRRNGEELLKSAPAGPTDPEAWKVTLGVVVAVTLSVLVLVGLLSVKR